jgi:hypothetical protein
LKENVLFGIIFLSHFYSCSKTYPKFWNELIQLSEENIFFAKGFLTFGKQENPFKGFLRVSYVDVVVDDQDLCCFGELRRGCGCKILIMDLDF